MTSPEKPLDRAGRRNPYLVLAKAVVSLALLVLAFSLAGKPGALETISDFPFWAWIAGVSLLALQIPVMAWRWSIILRASGMHIRFSDACRFTYTGFFFNQALPSSVGGDFMRAYQAGKTGLVFQPALVSVLLERATGLVMLALFSVLLLHGETATGGASRVHTSLIGLILAFAVLGFMLLLLLRHLVRRRRSGGKFRDFIDEVDGQFRKLLENPGAAAAILLLGGVSSLLGLGAIALAACSVALPLTGLQVLGVSALAIVATVIPVSISGWGVRESMFIVLMAPLGVSAESALGLSVWYGLVAVIASVPGGVVWLRGR